MDCRARLVCFFRPWSTKSTQGGIGYERRNDRSFSVSKHTTLPQSLIETTGASVSSNEPLTLVYSDTARLYGGVSIHGDALSPDSHANVAYYGQYLTTPEILFEGKAKPTEAAINLAQKLDEYSR